MKKTIKSSLKVIGFLVGLFGLIVCMCEAETLEKQVIVSCIGLGLFGIGCLVGLIGFRGGEQDVIR